MTDSYYNPTQQTYVEDIQDYAREAIAHLLAEKSFFVRSLQQLEDWFMTEEDPRDEDSLYDFIAEQADNSHYVFTNWQAIKVATEWSNNQDAYEEVGLDMDSFKSQNGAGNPLHKIAVSMAYFAVIADINDAINEILQFNDDTHSFSVKTRKRKAFFDTWVKNSLTGQRMKAEQGISEFFGN